MKILIVEDEEKLARFVELELMHEGYETAKAFDGRTGLEMAETGEFDLVLLDIMLPELSGTEVLRRLRKKSDIPVILLTARDSVMDKVSGLDSGADDYITKPFGMMTLISRIKAVLRRYDGKSYQSKQKILEADKIKIDITRHTVFSDNKQIFLTVKEFDLLVLLIENRPNVLTREQLLDSIWKIDADIESRTVDVHIRTLRQKLGEGGNIIETVRGVGYKCL